MKYIYNPETLMYDVVDEPRWARFLRKTGIFLAAVGLVVLFFWLYTSVFGLELPKTTILKRQNAAWKAKLDLVDRQLDLYDQVLEGLETRDDKVYRSIYGLNEVPVEVKGNIGTNRYNDMVEGGASAELQSMVRRADILAKRTVVQDKSLGEIEVMSHDAGEMIACVPSICPLVPNAHVFQLSSPFGMRIDPIFRVREYHKGQDFSAKRGTPIYATGDGTVTMVEYRFNGYGNQVVIDHGYGYQTRYAHMSSIDVHDGQKIHRGDEIGEVGSSGKSTGSHLHYEVIYKGRQVNPLNYMDLTMPADEYRAMIKSRSDESEENKRTSVTEQLLRRRRDANGI